MKVNPSEINNILVIRIGKLGDLVVTSFVFEIIKKNNPNINVTLITKESNKDLLKYNHTIKNIIYLKKGFTKYLQLFYSSFKKYDLIIDFNDNPSNTTKQIFRFYKSTYKCGYDFELYAKYINIAIPQLYKNKSHIVDRMADFLENIGFTIFPELVKPIVYLGKKENADVEKTLINSKQIITFNISAGAKIRYWEIEKWIELKNNILNKFPKVQIVILSTKEDKIFTSQILGNSNREDVLVPEIKSIQHFAAFIKNTNILVTPDTAAVHFASAFAIPVIALFSNEEWNYVSWLPYKTKNISLRSDNINSIKSISVQDVFNSVTNILNSNNDF